MATIVQRVVTRFRVAARAAGYYGWDPPDYPDPLEPPEDDWKWIVSAFPRPLQQKLKDPEEKSSSVRDRQETWLTSGVDLGEDFDLDAGLQITVTAYSGVDADEDGLAGYSGTYTEYELTAGRKSWSFSESHLTQARIKHDIKEWSDAIREANPEAAEKLDLP
jgi:hypothetical protein